MTSMSFARTATSTVLLATLLACGGHAGPAGPTPAIDRASPDGITEIRIRRGPSGWGPGRSYEARLRRDGTASYRGWQEVDRIGRFTATFPATTFDSLSRVLVGTPLFDRPPGAEEGQLRCHDAPTAEIIVVRAGVRYTALDTCIDREFEERYLVPAEEVIGRLEWR
jgi:hypothetical protein